jgi:acyl dehydratase
MTTILDGPPSILPLYVKSALPLLPGASSLPFVPGGGDEIPADLGFELTGVTTDAKQVSEYARVCGFRLRETLPPTFPHVVAFPLHMAIMSDGSFPFGAVGLVHIENSITQIRPIGIGEPLDVSATVSPLSPHPKGRIFSLRTVVSVEDEVAWTETSTMLRRGKGSETVDGSAANPLPTLDPEAPANATWSLPGDLGRRYGAVSGDRNPIHMHSLTAKPLGFRSAIAHGMWTKARALAQLENRLPDSFTATVRFRKPVFLPARVGFAAAERDEQTLFSVSDSREATPHLDGIIRADNPETEKARD